MNCLLLQQGYPVANIGGDAETRLAYYLALAYGVDPSSGGVIEDFKQMLPRANGTTKKSLIK